MTGAFTYDALPGRVVFGVGARAAIAAEVERVGARRVLLIASEHERELADELAALLGDRVAGRFTDVVQHVPVGAAAACVAFSVLSWTALVIFIVVIGGVGSTTGPIIGVLIFWFLDEQLADQETWRFIILGGLAAIMAIVAPKGIYGLLQQWRPLQFFPVRRRLIGPGVGE